MTKTHLYYYCYTLALFTNLAASADTNKNLSILLAEITNSTYEDITCYNCTAKDSWCFYINDLINHGSEAQVKCESNQCFIAEYLCDDKNSDDCHAEYNNAVNNDTLDYFYRRCATEEGEKPLRTRCKLCCNADATGNYTFSSLKNCYADEECDGFYDPTFTSTRCVCETNLCNYECNTADICMIRNDLLSILTSLYLFSYFFI